MLLKEYEPLFSLRRTLEKLQTEKDSSLISSCMGVLVDATASFKRSNNEYVT
jgi:hypothetical protein